jgi:hypothetical protein
MFVNKHRPATRIRILLHIIPYCSILLYSADLVFVSLFRPRAASTEVQSSSLYLTQTLYVSTYLAIYKCASGSIKVAATDAGFFIQLVMCYSHAHIRFEVLLKDSPPPVCGSGESTLLHGSS